MFERSLYSPCSIAIFLPRQQILKFMSHCAPAGELVLDDGAKLESEGFGAPLYATLSVYMVFLFAIGFYFWLKGRNKEASVEVGAAAVH